MVFELMTAMLLCLILYANECVMSTHIHSIEYSGLTVLRYLSIILSSIFCALVSFLFYIRGSTTA
jgi:hypothetical protein